METVHVQRGGVIRTYTLLEKLGSGSFSQVYKCKTVIDGKEHIYVVLLVVANALGGQGVQQVLSQK